VHGGIHVLQCVGVATLEKNWNHHVAQAEEIARSPGFLELRDRIVELAEPREHDIVVDVGSGTGLLTLALAPDVRRLIGTFTTRMPCCEPRVKNIRLIAAEIDGTVIRPGGQFSLNAVAGPRTKDEGYVEAPFIADGKIVPSVGGGVSQFSTTMYNAAFFAGLPIDAYQPHSIYISRYPPGREATLDFGTIDLRWTNDTSAPVLVRTTSTDTSVTVTLYGDNGGRRVRAEVGPRLPIPSGDFSITVTRPIRYGDGRIVREPVTTSYDAPQ